MNVVDQQGRALRLEAKALGSGGEGSVYAVAGQQGVVAKLYHTPPDAARVRKLAAMTALASPQLQAVCAWPGGVLTDPQRRVVGLLMPRVDLARARPIHDLTGPASRLRHFPGADYRFLVRAARNLAAAVATIHAHGQVVGDLNAANVYVTHQATVTLIDADSFQVSAGGERFLCPVGTTEFTPPELQGADLSRTARTPDHDAFGLATMIFQLLFLGHYPWAGVYADGRHLAMAEAIRAHHFAWGRGARAAGLRPPPAAPVLGSLPDEMAELFELAFGPAHQRPSAAEWVGALERLNASLVTCPLNSGHVHAGGRHCPWCALEAAARTTFFRQSRPPAPAANIGDIGSLWRQVEAVPPPPRVALNLPAFTVPLTPRVRARRRWASALMLVGLSLCLFGLYQDLTAWAFAGLLLAILAFVRSVTYRGDAATLRQVRAVHAEMAKAQADFEQRAEGHAQYLATKAELLRVYRELTGQSSALAERERQAAQEYQHRCLVEYLDTQPLDLMSVPGVGEKRLRLLHSHGVATAADVDTGRLANIPSIGGKTRGQLLAWRRGLEEGFRGRGAPSLPSAARQTLQRQVADEARVLSERLSHGPAALRQTHLLAQGAHARAQAEVDGHQRTRALLIQML